MWKPNKHDIHSKTQVTGLNKSHPVKVSYQLWGQEVTQKQCLKGQKTQVTSVRTPQLYCHSYSVHLSCAHKPRM